MGIERTVQGFNVVSPYGRVEKYDSGSNKGFYFRAASSDFSHGWGEPKVDETGKEILPGTPGGNFNIQYAANRASSEGSSWIGFFEPGTQLYGEVDWDGPWKRMYPLPEGSPPGTTPEPDKARGRVRLSFHGPVSRVFANDNFVYGTKEEHNNIYLEGACIAVAPLPVMGAALTEGFYEGQQAVFLVVACYKDPTTTEFYSRVYVPSDRVSAKDYTSEWRDRSQNMGPGLDSKGNLAYSKWSRIGEHSAETCTQGEVCSLKGQRTPWLFNMSGTKAYQMRECEITFVYCTNPSLPGEDASLTQEGYNLFQADITASSASVVDEGNTEGFSITLDSLWEQKPNYVKTVKWPDSESPEYPHTWECRFYKQDMSVSGTYNIGVDWDEDTLLMLRVKAEVIRQQQQWWYKGVDIDTYGSVPPYVNLPLGPHYNNQTVGNRYAGDTVDRNPYYIIPGDGRSAPYLDMREQISLGWVDKDGNGWDLFLLRRGNGTLEEFENKQADPNNNINYFFFEEESYPQYLKASKKAAMLFTKQRVRYTSSGLLKVVDDKNYWGAWTGGAVVSPIGVFAYPPVTQQGGFGLYKVWPTEGTYEPPAEWKETGFSNIMTYKTYTGGFHPESMSGIYPRLDINGDIITPDPRNFYNGCYFYGPWISLKDHISSISARSYSGFGMGADDNNGYAFSIGVQINVKQPDGSYRAQDRFVNKIVYPDTDLKNLLLPEQDAGVVDGEGKESPVYWFYPIGVA